MSRNSIHNKGFLGEQYKNKTSKKSDLIRRYLILLIGLLIMAFGVAFSIKAALGTSPISSLPYVTSEISGLTVGRTTILLHCTLVVIQILILRRRYQLIQLLQLAVAFVFGYMTDFAVAVTASVSYHNYFQQWLLCIIGILLVGIGVACEVTANVIMLAGEGTVAAIVTVTEKSFPKLKVAFDCTLVVISIILSLVFLHGIEGVREGTVAAALLVGPVSKLVRIAFKKISTFK